MPSFDDGLSWASSSSSVSKSARGVPRRGSGGATSSLVGGRHGNVPAHSFSDVRGLSSRCSTSSTQATLRPSSKKQLEASAGFSQAPAHRGDGRPPYGTDLTGGHTPATPKPSRRSKLEEEYTPKAETPRPYTSHMKSFNETPSRSAPWHKSPKKAEASGDVYRGAAGHRSWDETVRKKADPSCQSGAAGDVHESSRPRGKTPPPTEAVRMSTLDLAWSKTAPPGDDLGLTGHGLQRTRLPLNYNAKKDHVQEVLRSDVPEIWAGEGKNVAVNRAPGLEDPNTLRIEHISDRAGKTRHPDQVVRGKLPGDCPHHTSVRPLDWPIPDGRARSATPTRQRDGRSETPRAVAPRTPRATTPTRSPAATPLRTPVRSRETSPVGTPRQRTGFSASQKSKASTRASEASSARPSTPWRQRSPRATPAQTPTATPVATPRCLSPAATPRGTPRQPSPRAPKSPQKSGASTATRSSQASERWDVESHTSWATSRVTSAYAPSLESPPVSPGSRPRTAAKGLPLYSPSGGSSRASRIRA